jgi:hypothetical protein
MPVSAFFDKSACVQSCRQLPLRVDAQCLQREVRSLPGELWAHNRAPVHRETRALFLKGHPPLLRIPDDSDRPALNQCPYIRQLLYELIPGRPGKCLLAALRPQGIVYPHRDTANAYFRGSLRIHVPVFTNTRVALFNNGCFFRMREGEVWTINNLVPHAVINDHPDLARVHLIFDVFPEQAALALIASAAEAVGEHNGAMFRRLQSTARASRG